MLNFPVFMWISYFIYSTVAGPLKRRELDSSPTDLVTRTVDPTQNTVEQPNGNTLKTDGNVVRSAPPLLACICNCEDSPSTDSDASAPLVPKCECKCFDRGTASPEDVKEFISVPNAVRVILDNEPSHIVQVAPAPLPESTASRIKERCNVDSKLCSGSSAVASELRAFRKKEQVAHLLKGDRRVAKSEAEITLRLVQRAKIAVHSALGVGGVLPIDDGIWEGDIILTTQQAHDIIRDLSPPAAPFDLDAVKKPASSWADILRSKRSAFDFSISTRFLWDSFPIPYHLGNTGALLSRSATDIVRTAFDTVERQTKCITFNEQSSAFSASSVIKVVQSQTLKPCETESHLGKTESGTNLILVGSLDQCPRERAIAQVIHAILHTLGMKHTHTRVDRDQHIQVNWENIEPGQLHAFAVDGRSLTNYNVNYSYSSLMHLPRNKFGIIDFLGNSANTLTPLRDTETAQNLLGNTLDLSAEDVQMLDTAYCSSGLGGARDKRMEIFLTENQQDYQCDCLCTNQLYALEAALSKDPQDSTGKARHKSICGCNCLADDEE